MKILNHAFRSFFVNLRLFIIVFWLLILIFILKIFSFFITNDIRFRKFRIFLQMVFCRLMLFLAGIKVVLKNKEGFFNKQKNCLIVSNHQSYWDVITLASLAPMVFISNTEVEQTKGLGLISRSGGAIFINRIDKKQVIKDIKAVSELLKQGFDVVLFPEGTTSDGKNMLPFKAPFFKSAIDAEKNIFLVCIIYKNTNGDNIGEKMVYHSNESFLKHFKKIISMEDKRVEINFLGELPYSSDRKNLVNKSYLMIKNTFEKK